MNKKILITGGTGFIGYHLAKKCLKLNWSVTCLSTKKPIKIRRLKKVNYIFSDISKKKNLKKKINANYNYVVNLAGYVDHSHKIKTIRSHFNGCKNISSLFVNSKIEKFVQIGSSVEYGKIKSPQKENEFSKNKILSNYGEAKLMSTKFLLDLNKKFNFPSVIVRLYLVYGPYQDPNRVVPYTILNSIHGKKFNCSNGKQLRDFLYIDDVINGIIKILKKKELSGEIINLGYGKPKSVKNVILKISKIINSGKPKFGNIPLRKDEIFKLYPEISKAKKVLKWRPKTNIDIGLNKTINFYRRNIFKFNFK